MKTSRTWHPAGDGLFKWREFGDSGPPICFTNPNIRRMLKLARAGREDVLYELGSGWGQNLLIACREFGVKECVGIERIGSRYETALRRIRRRSLSKRIRITKGDFQDLLKGEIPNANISDATIVLYTLETDAELVDDMSNRLREGCRLVYSSLTLFPEIKPSAVDYPFYVSQVPFAPPTSELEWLTSVLQREGSGPSKSANDLWSELYHDYNVEREGKRAILDYQRRLGTVLRKSEEIRHQRSASAQLGEVTANL